MGQILTWICGSKCMAEINSNGQKCCVQNKIGTFEKAVFLYCTNLQKEKLLRTIDEEGDIISDINILFNLEK